MKNNFKHWFTAVLTRIICLTVLLSLASCGSVAGMVKNSTASVRTGMGRPMPANLIASPLKGRIKAASVRQAGNMIKPLTESAAEEDVFAYNQVEDYSISTLTDYAHGSDGIVLGNDEGVTVTIKAKPAGLTAEDFLFMYDEKELHYTVKNVRSDAKAKTTEIVLYVTALIPCQTVFEVYSVSDIIDYYEDEEGIPYIPVRIYSLNYQDGRVVYVSNTGEKYHFSRECCGEYAVKTTLWDARDYNYEPCKKCAR